MTNDLRLFQTDYIISWDFSNADDPCVQVAQLSRQKESQRLSLDLIGRSYAKAGCVSLRQAISDYDENKRNEEKEHTAEWLDSHGDSKCSACGFSCSDDYYLGAGRFCPECGADMKNPLRKEEAKK